MAIQLIINRELGLAKNENPLQGSFIIEKLSHLVEEAIYREFERISERGGVLGAMETMYQRGKIQEESLYYERSEEHTYELQSLMRISYAVFCLQQQIITSTYNTYIKQINHK